jgi:hypothetical protein
VLHKHPYARLACEEFCRRLLEVLILDPPWASKGRNEFMFQSTVQSIVQSSVQSPGFAVTLLYHIAMPTLMLHTTLYAHIATPTLMLHTSRSMPTHTLYAHIAMPTPSMLT